MMVTLSTSTLLAEKIHVEGYYKNSSFEIGDSWLDSGKRQHFESAKSLGEISLYSENFSFRGTSVADFSLSFLDKNSMVRWWRRKSGHPAKILHQVSMGTPVVK